MRSLDHQGIAFKMTDKKVPSTKTFVMQIEAVMEMQMARRTALVDPLSACPRPWHQPAHENENADVRPPVLVSTNEGGCGVKCRCRHKGIRPLVR